MAKLRLIDRWAAFTDAELRALEGALDLVESHAPVDSPPGTVESLSDEIGSEIQRRGADAQGRLRGAPCASGGAMSRDVRTISR